MFPLTSSSQLTPKLHYRHEQLPASLTVWGLMCAIESCWPPEIEASWLKLTTPSTHNQFSSTCADCIGCWVEASLIDVEVGSTSRATYLKLKPKANPPAGDEITINFSCTTLYIHSCLEVVIQNSVNISIISTKLYYSKHTQSIVRQHLLCMTSEAPLTYGR